MQDRYPGFCNECGRSIEAGQEITRSPHGDWVHSDHDNQVDYDERECQHEYSFSRYCGADVCVKCGDHKGLSSCFCGWNGHRSDPEARYQERWGW